LAKPTEEEKKVEGILVEAWQKVEDIKKEKEEERDRKKKKRL
jgi:hypothetical protein